MVMTKYRVLANPMDVVILKIMYISNTKAFDTNDIVNKLFGNFMTNKEEK